MSTNRDTGSKTFSTAILVVLVLAAIAGAYMIGKNSGGKSANVNITLAAPTNTASTATPQSVSNNTSTNNTKAAQNSSKKVTGNAVLRSSGVFYIAGKVSAVDDKYLSVKTDSGQVIKVAYRDDARVIYPVANKVTVTKPENMPKPVSGTTNTSASSSATSTAGASPTSKTATTNTQAGKSKDIKAIKTGTGVIASIKVNPDGTFVVRTIRINK